ncbi:BTB/POZ and MATH domain-containing protein [Sporobolomyces salmoneus]|uniref:BTB/POZ and MATH domain-containing protein n=1 Tax=Sporobolomyces salmoneus TaxID=183962 RepID=UPI00316C878B
MNSPVMEPSTSTGGPTTYVTPPAPSLDSSDVLETRSVQLEWKVNNLKQLFDSTKGEHKSKCVKSPLFDNSRWQIFLYPNSGHEQHLSVYLSAEPTAAEKERGAPENVLFESPWQKKDKDKDGKDKEKDKDKDKTPWKREGKFKFTFEARDLNRRLTFKQMEADNHSFSSKERNWGYQTFWKRSEAYYSNPATRSSDAFLIVCTITSSPVLPATSNVPLVSIPKDLVNSYASLFDDPEYCDVVFRIRPEDEDNQGGGKNKRKREKKLFAAKKILSGRSEYFQSMFNSGFNESTARISSEPRRTSSEFDELNDDDTESDASSDSDDDGEDGGIDEDDDSQVDESEEEEEDDSEEESNQPIQTPRPQSVVPFPTSVDLSASTNEPKPVVIAPLTPRSRTSSAAISNDGDSVEITSSEDQVEPSAGDISESEEQQQEEGKSNTPPHSPPRFRSAPSSPARSGFQLSMSQIPKKKKVKEKKKEEKFVRPRSEVIVADASYSTFRALLYYLYTNQISFTPLASTFYAAKDRASASNTPFPYSSRKAFILAHSPHSSSKGGVGPASAKALYRLADKMGLMELKQLAFDHIVASLTPQNCIYEAFGSFAMRFEEVRKVEVAFLLSHWNEVRTSGSMAKVFGFLRTGRFPGFEEVWLSLIEHLEYKAPGTKEVTEGES